jgi:hypothetical protein
MATITRRYSRDAVDEAELQGVVQTSATVVRSGTLQADINVDDATSGIEATADAFMLERGFRFQEQNPAATMYSRFFRQTLLSGEQTIIATPGFESVGQGIIFDAGAWAPNPANAALFIEGAYRADGADTKLVFSSQNPDGSGLVSMLPDLDFADTAGVYTTFELVTTSVLPTGLQEYIAEASLGGSTSLDLKNISITLVELPSP